VTFGPLLCAAAVLLCAAPAVGAAPSLALRAVPRHFDGPVWVGGADDGSSTLYVAEQRGIVWKLAGGRTTKFLDIRSSIHHEGEQGLLSLGFAHDFARSGRMFVWCVATTRTGQLRQYRVHKGKVVPGSGRLVLSVPLAPPSATNHNGGTVWPMADGSVLLSVGDGGGSGDPNRNAQHLGRLTGKILRVTPKLGGGYVVPKDNPFVHRRGARHEVWALGLRNPWRFSVDPLTKRLWIGDVGQDRFEEIDVQPAAVGGANFGWSRMEGNSVFNAGRRLTSGTKYVKPRFVYSHASGGCSVTGGLVYRGPLRQLRGYYLFGDYCTSTISLLSPATFARTTRRGVPGIVHFGAGTRTGDVFVASKQTGRIYKVVAG
jgi:glucose/arabinose dehydrogenase